MQPSGANLHTVADHGTRMGAGENRSVERVSNLGSYPLDAVAVGQETLDCWSATAISSRTIVRMLGAIGDPLPGSPLNEDDAAYPWEKCSAWTKQNLQASADHLTLWADTIAPLEFVEGSENRSPVRPYFTLARAALEAASMAVWVLEPSASVDRVLRHLRLVHHDFVEHAKVLKLDGGEPLRIASERRRLLLERSAEGYTEKDIKSAPSILSMVREAATFARKDADGHEAIWRTASAAAHGKNWFQPATSDVWIGKEYEPGAFRTVYLPQPAAITRTVEAAVAVAQWGILHYAVAAGLPYRDLYDQALSEVVAITPIKRGSEGIVVETLARMKRSV